MEIKNSVLVDLQVGIWSGTRKMIEDDLADNNDRDQLKLPPTVMASLGSKRLCDPADLGIFRTIKSQALGYLERRSTKFLSGWLSSVDRTQEIHTTLSAYKKEFEQATAQFLADYQSNIEAWRRQFPEWEAALRRSSVDVEYVTRSFHFNFVLYQLADAEASSNEVIAESITNEISTLADSVFGNVATMAKKYLDDITVDEHGNKVNDISRRNLGRLYKIQEKLDALSFIHPEVGGALELLNEFEPLIVGNGKGPVDGQEHDLLVKLLTVLSEPQLCRQLASDRLGLTPSAPVVLEVPPSAMPGAELSGQGTHRLF